MTALMALVLMAGNNAGGNIVAEGQGTLQATGSGTVFLRGSGSVELTGEGSMWYKDLEGDAAITSEKSSVFETDGWKFLNGIGTFKLSGTHFIIMALGKNMSLKVQGRGKAHLVGKGTFQLGNRTGTWDDTPRSIPFGKPGFKAQNQSGNSPK